MRDATWINCDITLDSARRIIIMPGSLAPAVTIEDNPAEVFCLRWSEDGQYLASGIGDGSLRVFSADR